jgi:two-component system, OmpR family, phosphate regulon sensor histidine kinase PhoR
MHPVMQEDEVLAVPSQTATRPTRSPRGTAIVLVTGLSVLLCLVLISRLGWVEALAGGLVLVSAALIARQPAFRQLGFDEASLGPNGPDAETIAALTNALPDPCLILDRRGVVVHRNRQAEQMFPSVTPGLPLAFSLRHPALIAAAEAAGRGELRTIEWHQTGPSESWHKVTVAPFAPHGFEERGLRLMLFQDLTELKRIEALRSDFIANASHELRTPLTSVIGFIDTLLGPAAKDAEAREKFLGIMRGQAGRMSKLIDDLLSLSRIEMRQHLRPTGAVDILRILSDVCDGLQTQIEDAGITLVLPEGKAIVIGDREELHETIENLLENAVKYGKEGGKVEIAIAEARLRGDPAYRLSIIDDGPGVAPEHVPRLTERFYRVDTEGVRRKKGTGLGLAIVKHIVARHRGELAISSKLGLGTRVDVTLPKAS